MSSKIIVKARNVGTEPLERQCELSYRKDEIIEQEDLKERSCSSAMYPDHGKANYKKHKED